MIVGLLYGSLISIINRYYGTSVSVPGSGLSLTVDNTNFFADSTVLTADATVTP